MNLNQNDTGILKFGDNTTARVKVVSVEHSRSGMFPTDYWFEYEDGETNRQIIHPDLGSLDIIKSSIVLPEGLVAMVFIKDGSTTSSIIEEKEDYEQRLNVYLDKTMLPEDKQQGKILFKKMEKFMSRKEIIVEYFDKE
jgi:hypothetical protein